jgi:hypothetical protein
VQLLLDLAVRLHPDAGAPSAPQRLVLPQACGPVSAMDIFSNTTFASALVGAANVPPQYRAAGILNSLLGGLNGWGVALATLLTLVAYDQCTSSPRPRAPGVKS